MPPISSISFSQSFLETNAADLFFGLRYAKPKSPISIFTHKCRHMQWPSIHMSSQFLCRLVFLETNATILFVSLWYVKPKKPASIFGLTCLHTRPEIWLSIHLPLKVAVDCYSDSNEIMPSSCTFLSLKRFPFASIFLKHKLLIF